MDAQLDPTMLTRRAWLQDPAPGYMAVILAALIGCGASVFGAVAVGAAGPPAVAQPDNFTADEQTPASLASPTPAFAGQMEAPPKKSVSKFAVEVVAGGLASPWSLAFLPDGKMLVTEVRGTMRIVTKDGVHSSVEGVPPVKNLAAQGLHDVVLDPGSGLTAKPGPERAASESLTLRLRPKSMHADSASLRLRPSPTGVHTIDDR